MEPLVSIVTPSLNCGAFIEETLLSVERQDYPHVEHIVLDSGSTDDTPSVLARHPSAMVVTCPRQGVSEKVNHGISIARGEIIGWINSDDFYLPGAISKAVNALTRHPDAALVYCNFLQVDEQSVEIGRERTRQASWEEMLSHIYIPMESAFIRRSALKQVGPLDTRYPLVQDWDLFLRISKQFPVVYVDDYWSAFRHREGQQSSLYQYDFWRQSVAMTREHGGRFLPLFVDYWGTKLRRAGRMVRSGNFRQLRSKLGKNILSVARHRSIRNRTDY